MIPERTKKHRRKLILGVYTQVTGYRLIQRRIIVTDEDRLSCQEKTIEELCVSKDLGFKVKLGLSTFWAFTYSYDAPKEYYATTPVARKVEMAYLVKLHPHFPLNLTSMPPLYYYIH
ncbi:hypothetical protein YC2023_002696 [Brassica napus]